MNVFSFIFAYLFQDQREGMRMGWVVKKNSTFSMTYSLNSADIVNHTHERCYLCDLPLSSHFPFDEDCLG